ncbi:GerAB/ArcD/ProY family transporter [Alicyclobacillus tolerans]|uniref:GerAB/ArcD/ProY family transporter n=1 Tax=Alicyclobacillus tolerans TaxID=90970 RepID=UPI001F00BFFA|nr:GerAB/ArcD/ProY family transporter [Alicyclobacillus tolerans]MCF8568048.1 GerAB/ArcD/ProY family transporter [Alicyclobacillus tolerans]
MNVASDTERPIGQAETFFLAMMTLPVMGHAILVPLLLQIAGRDAWLSVLLTIPFAVVFVGLVWHIRRNTHDEPQAILIEAAGNLLGKFLAPLFSAYFFFLSMLSVVFVVDMAHIYFFPETPSWALTAFYVLFMMYAVQKNVWSMAMTATILGIITVFTGNSTAFLSFPHKDWAEIRPLMEFGWRPVIWGSIVMLSMWTELLFLLFIPTRKPAHVIRKSMPSGWWILVLANAYMTFSSLLGVVAFFGFHMVRNFTYPTAEELSLLSLGFIDRFSIYVIINLSFGCFIRTGLYFRLGYELLLPCAQQNKLKPWFRKVLTILILETLGYIANFVACDHVRVVQWTEFYTYTAGLFVIPLILYGLQRIRAHLRHSS